jgi:hypothetical protein
MLKSTLLMEPRNMKKQSQIQIAVAVSTVFAVFFIIACSGAQPTDHSFFIKPTTQTNAASQASSTTKQVTQTKVEEVNRSVDLLWVVDNSASMEVSQDKLRKAFAGFSSKFMTPNLDIRTAVITTDLYLANPAFSDYWASTLTDSATHVNYRQDQLHPTWNADYAKLLPGIHDGPVPAMCDEGVMGDFYLGPSKCAVRDNVAAGTGADHCVSPAADENMITQCVNTVNNNTIHSGQPILSTIPPQGTDAADWQKQLIRNFTINVSVGASGSGAEKGLGSLVQFLNDNEAPTSTTKFFRPGSLRVIVFLSDEDDQTQVIPATPSATFKPTSNYLTSCPTKTVGGFTYTLTDCVNPTTLAKVSDIKNQVDTFFNTLDGLASGPNPNYLVASVVSSTGATIQKLQNLQKTMQKQAGLRVTTDQNIGQRYIDFANLVLKSTPKNGSEVIDIGAEDYTSVLQNIGQKIVTNTPVSVPVTSYAPIATFQLNHPADPNSQVVVSILHADGSTEELNSSQFTVSGTQVTITDQSVIQSLGPDDKWQVTYRPHGAYES